MEVVRPRLLPQIRGLDFGAGFHLTTSEGQAMRFSEIVTARRKSGTATVSVYEFFCHSYRVGSGGGESG